MTDALPAGVTEQDVESYMLALRVQAGGMSPRDPAKARDMAVRILAAQAERDKSKEKGPTRFTTGYAIQYGERHGWTLLDRERWNSYARGGKGAHQDTFLGSDAVFVKKGGGLVLIQGAGKNEKPDHRRRFEERGGVAKCIELGAEFYYIEFTRGKPKAPHLVERWAE